MNLQCKECGDSVHKMRLLQHLKFYHGINSYFEYAKKYDFLFIRKYLGEYVSISNFENKCNLCGGEFKLHPYSNTEFEVVRCLTNNCSKKSLENTLLQCFDKKDVIYAQVYTKYISKLALSSDIENISKRKGISIEEAIRFRGEWNQKTSGTLENFIKRYGKEEGTTRYNTFCVKSARTLENFINQYGENLGYEKWVNYKQNLKGGSSCTIDYWLKKTDGNLDEAKELLRKRQTFDLEFIINKYGEEIGRQKYEESSRLKAQTLENKIRLYGLERAEEIYHDWLLKVWWSNTLEGKIEKYGELEGLQKHNKTNKLKAITLDNMIRVHGLTDGIIKYDNWKNNLLYRNKRFSNKSKLFFDLLVDLLGTNKYKYYYAENEWFVSLPNKIYFVDFYIKELNYAIEFNGDYWHGNPRIYSGEEYTYRGNQIKEIWKKDNSRLLDIKQKIANIDVIWEYDVEHDIQNVLSNIMIKIKEIENNVLR